MSGIEMRVDFTAEAEVTPAPTNVADTGADHQEEA